MIVEGINGYVEIQFGLLVWLAGMSAFGLFMVGVALSVAITNMWQRRTMHGQVMKYAHLMERMDAYVESVEQEGIDSLKL